MVIHRNEMKAEVKVRMRDGEGTVTMTKLVPPEVMHSERLIANIEIPPGASIGVHEHLHETEYFLVVNGSGDVYDNGEIKRVRRGDVIITGNGSSHGIKNTGAVPLILHAIIITY